MGEEYLSTITMTPVIDTEGDKIKYEVQNSQGHFWKFSSSIGWNDKNKEFPVWINFNNNNEFKIVIDHAVITN